MVEDALSITATIPSRKHWFLILFLGAWLCGWFVGEIMVPLTFFDERSGAPVRLFSITWLAAWTIGGVAAIYTFAWSLAGREIVTLDQSCLSIKKELFRIGRLKEYALEHVTNLRAAPAPYNPRDPRSALQFWGVGGGLAAFDYGSATVRFGAALEEGEAGALVTTFKERARKSGHSAV
ncbi:MAG: hypothetical protein ABI616_02825 [Pseudomonadota bacterium]